MLAFWFSRTYGLPPNHPLFVQETMTYWRQQFYMDCLRRREVMWNEVQQLKAANLTGKAQSERQAQVADKMGGIDEINGLLGEAPAQAPAPVGKMPEFLRQAAAERRGLSGRHPD